MSKKKSINEEFINVVRKLSEVESDLVKSGWIKANAGKSSSVDQIYNRVNSADYNYQFDLYIRRRNLEYLINSMKEKADTLKKSAISETQPLLSTPAKEAGSNPAMGIPKECMTPSSSDALPRLSDLGDYPSLQFLCDTYDHGIVIAFDSEWFYDEFNDRCMLSWQFACVQGNDLIEFVFLRKCENRRMTLELAIGRILDSIAPKTAVDVRKVVRYKTITGIHDKTGEYKVSKYKTKSEAMLASIMPFEDGKVCHSFYDWSLVEHIKIALVCHAGKVDLSSFDQMGGKHLQILKHCSEVQGGLVTLQPVFFTPASLNPKKSGNHGTYRYPVTLTISDTMCHAPAGKKSLKDLGSILRWDKIKLEENEITQMDKLLISNPVKYMEYASNDSIITLLYAASIYGYNTIPPVTITSVAASVMKSMMMDYFQVKETKDFDRVYRGLEEVCHGKCERSSFGNGVPQYLEMTSKEPISDKANTIQHYSSHAFHGGYNSCSDIGYFNDVTFDYDLQNAYPTAMCLVNDVDWENPVSHEIINRELTLQDFLMPGGGYNAVSMMVAYVRFEFPRDIKYPCIPVNVDGIPIFPRTSNGLNGVYACGPELYLALRIGAKVFCEHGYVLNPIVKESSAVISCSLKNAVKQLVKDRSIAKKMHNRGSLEEQILKTMVNSGYGKNAQNVIQKHTWSAYKDCMEIIGCSSITNPFSACMITSIVRAVLIAAQNQCHALGYMTCSVTTDGFISNVPQNILKELDLYGLRNCMEEARLFLTDGDNPEIWEIKHAQDDLVNFTTRGNVSLHWNDNPMVVENNCYAGVCAHNGAKSAFPSDTFEDRKWLMVSVLERTGCVESIMKEWTPFKNLVKGEKFSVKTVIKNIRMDFDMKRKPVRNSFTTSHPRIDETTYEIANFTTVPFEDVDEYRLYRDKKKLVAVLRTEDDWEKFWTKIDLKDTNLKVRDLEWARINSCVMGHRSNLWTIPHLTYGTVEEKCRWINKHNKSKKLFKESDWKNAARPERQARMLPREYIEKLLDELMNDG